MNEPKTTNDEAATARDDELGAEQLEHVSGGVGLLLPAVQANKLLTGDGSVQPSEVDGRDFLVWQRNFGTSAAKK